jgi:hypothetical protein
MEGKPEGMRSRGRKALRKRPWFGIYEGGRYSRYKCFVILLNLAYILFFKEGMKLKRSFYYPLCLFVQPFQL